MAAHLPCHPLGSARLQTTRSADRRRCSDTAQNSSSMRISFAYMTDRRRKVSPGYIYPAQPETVHARLDGRSDRHVMRPRIVGDSGICTLAWPSTWPPPSCIMHSTPPASVALSPRERSPRCRCPRKPSAGVAVMHRFSPMHGTSYCACRLMHARGMSRFSR